MQLKVTRATQAGHSVSEMILGHNIEMCLTTGDGLLSDRLRNPKLLGPPHPVTGVAPQWQGASCGQGSYELAPGSGLMGSEAQLIRVAKSHAAHHLHQNKISVRAGEKLELEIWARVCHRPVKLKASLLPLSSRTPAYDSGELEINTSYFKRYTLPLSAPQDDDEARLSLRLEPESEIWIDQVHLRPKDEPLLCQGLIDEMAAMRIPTLRFPGGIVVNAYNWRHGTGPVHLRRASHDPAFHQDWNINYDFGLDEYLRLCVDQGITPALTFNIATGTPEEATEMAAYCADWFQRAGVPAPLIYWHIGNHPYSFTTASMTAAMYIEVIKTFVPAVKAVYPNNRIVAVMSGGSLATEPDKAEWREALFGEVADLIDVVQVQIYGGSNPVAPAEKQLESLTYNLANAEKDMRSFIALCRSRNVRWKLGIAEWNWWMQASHWDGRAFEEPPTALHGLFIAGMIHRFAKLSPNFEVAHFYNLVNCMGILNQRNATVEITDAVEIFKLYRPALPGQFIPLTWDTDVEAVEAIAIENDAATWLFLTNRSLTETAHVSLEGLKVTQADGVCMSAASPISTFTHAEPQINGETLTVPPLSIIRVKCTNS